MTLETTQGVPPHLFRRRAVIKLCCRVKSNNFPQRTTQVLLDKEIGWTTSPRRRHQLLLGDQHQINKKVQKEGSCLTLEPLRYAPSLWTPVGGKHRSSLISQKMRNKNTHTTVTGVQCSLEASAAVQRNVFPPIRLFLSFFWDWVCRLFPCCKAYLVVKRSCSSATVYQRPVRLSCKVHGDSSGWGGGASRPLFRSSAVRFAGPPVNMWMCHWARYWTPNRSRRLFHRCLNEQFLWLAPCVTAPAISVWMGECDIHIVESTLSGLKTRKAL